MKLKREDTLVSSAP